MLSGALISIKWKWPNSHKTFNPNKRVITTNICVDINLHITYIQAQLSFGDIEWDKTTQGWILSAFYLGFGSTQAFGGILAGRYGGKLVLFSGQVILTIATILTPIAARFAKIVIIL